MNDSIRASLWQNGVQLPAFPSLDHDIKTDVLIIGGGLAGILCALTLHRAHIDYVLVEADRICRGVTANTTAKITIQHGLIYDKLIQAFGIERAQMYLHAQQTAFDSLANLCSEADCDFQHADNYIYALDNPENLMREATALHKLGASPEVTENLPLPLSTAGAVCMPEQAQFHPLKFVSAISNGLHIYENTRVTELAPGFARAEHGSIRADKIIVATHFPFLNKHGSYFLKLYQHRSYVVALEHTEPISGMYVDEKDDGLSFRCHDRYLLLGGGGHRTGKTGGGWRELLSFANAHYPNARAVCQWATQDCMTLDGVPYIGQYAQRTPGLYVTTGFNKWGMTNAMAGALLLRDMLTGKTPDWAAVFSPSRSILHKQLLVNSAESTLNLLTPTTPRCPHLGCALKYNAQEHSWDCPCHGSRFSDDGTLLNNPATGNMKKP